MKENFDKCLEMLLHHEGAMSGTKKTPGAKLTLESQRKYIRTGVAQKR